MTPAQVIRTFGGRLVGNTNTKNLVAAAVQKLPEDQAQYISHHVWILSSHPDSWAYAFHGDDLKNQHLIFLSDDLLTQSDRQITFTLLHEFGHILLGHKNSIDSKQSHHTISKQEQEADHFAIKILKSSNL